MSRAPVAQCKLCLKQKKLNSSHILPEFLYRELYEKNKGHAVKISSNSEKVEYIQKGIREYLLCGNCEEILSKYEHYAAPIIKGIPLLPLDITGHLLKTLQVDYAKFKLFQMSIIWRASVSTHPMFNLVSLGNQEKRLREMLLYGRPGKSHQFACLMLTIQNTKNLYRILWSPIKDIKYGRMCFCFQIGEIFWYFFRSSLPKSNLGRQGFLSEKGELKILIAPWTEDQIVSQYISLLKTRPKTTKELRGS